MNVISRKLASAEIVKVKLVCEQCFVKLHRYKTAIFNPITGKLFCSEECKGDYERKSRSA